MGKIQINTRLLPMKWHYFLWNAGTAPITPYLSVYANQLGYSSFIVGIIYMIMPIAGMIAKPLMGAVADKYRCQKAIFLSMIVVTAAAFISILYVPGIDLETKVHFKCDYSESVIDTCLSEATQKNSNSILNKVNNLPNITANCRMNCSLNEQSWNTVSNYWHAPEYNVSHPKHLLFTAHLPLDLADDMNMNCVFFKVKNVTLESGQSVLPLCPSKENKIASICDISCDSPSITALLPKSNTEDSEVYKYYQFWLFLVLMVIGWIGQAVVVSVTDAVCFDMLGDKPNKYGNQRLFGSLGWGIFSVIAGLILDAMSNDQDGINYTGVFYLSLAIFALDFFVSYRLKYEQKHLSTSIFRDVTGLLTNVRIFIFMLWCIFVGMCTGLIWNFLFWLLEDLAGDNKEWIKTLEGIAMAIQCLGGELPFFFLSGWILKRLGHVHSMTLILAALGVRFILYSLLTNPWWVLPIEFLNGITFGLFYACMASYASIVAPPGTATTVQGLVGAIFEGIGVSLGSFLGGYMFDKYTGSIMYRIFGIVALILCLVHAFVQYILQRRSKGEDKPM